MDKKVVMISPNEKLVGGVSSVIQALISSETINQRVIFLSSNGVKNSFHSAIFHLIKVFAKLVFLFITNRIDLVHIHTSSYFSFLRKSTFILLCVLFNRKFIIHIHGGAFVRFYKDSNAPLKKYIYSLLMRASKVVVVSKSFSKEFESCFSIRSIVIPNFSKANYTNSFNNYDSYKYLYLGDISEIKGFEDALIVIKRLKEENDNIELICAGRNVNGFLEKMITKYDCSSYVNYLGFVNEYQKEQLFMSSHALISPSHMESFGMSNLEAALRGIPVIAYAVGGVPDVIEDYKNGFLVKFRDLDNLHSTLVKLRNSNCLYQSISSGGVEYTREKFSIENISKQYVKLYNEVINN
ncbi:hypothetical protein VCHA34P116_70039 [Vibrio chagasii]|nr:hypothetical protein VCHA34P116_70039 [Vibrio chagasii]CAH7054027.1 hypothetical protein VCHA35O137_80038 [Vibrio chagasii]CAH7064750.1 hypothetical protein VCHA32P90_80177 [Vibrio chagasii]CAH7362287.1 hypothetical protein VCHA53O469_70177 [Vibrio chagasii]CAH7377866.1 hypothetical protein VCHA39P230_80040 [Vibrio chagasii]